MTTLELRQEDRHGARWLIPVGELDLDAASLLEAALCDRGPGACAIVLDLRELRFIDSSGIRVLLRARAESAADRWELTIVRPEASAVLGPLQLVGVDELLGLVDAAELTP